MMLFVLIRYLPILIFAAALFYWHRARKLNLPEKTQKIYGWIAIAMLIAAILSLLAFGLSQ